MIRIQKLTFPIKLKSSINIQFLKKNYSNNSDKNDSDHIIYSTDKSQIMFKQEFLRPYLSYQEPIKKIDLKEFQPNSLETLEKVEEKDLDEIANDPNNSKISKELETLMGKLDLEHELNNKEMHLKGKKLKSYKLKIRLQDRLEKSLTIKDQFINNLMKDGKKSLAQRLLEKSLKYVENQTHLKGEEILNICMEKCCPIIKMKRQKRFNKFIQVPLPLTEKQKRRRAIKWIVEESKKRKGYKFPDQLGMEFISILNDTSKVIKKKQQLHLEGLNNQSNILLKDIIPNRRS